MSDLIDITGPVEAILFVAEEPVTEIDLAQAVDVPVTTVQQCLAQLVAFYDETGRGFQLRQLAGGWRYYTRAQHAEVVGGFLSTGVNARLSRAALETLAVVAYQQPISRSRISAVRGVSVDGVVRTLLARGLLTEAGHDQDSNAVVLRTTNLFLERMGLRALDELPPLAPHLPEVSEMEAELSQLARSGAAAAADEPDPPSPPTVPTEAQHRDEDST